MNAQPTGQALFAFEQTIVNAEAAAAYAKLQAQLAAEAQLVILKRQAEIEKSYRRFKRTQKRKERTSDEYAQCGIRHYFRSPLNVALGNYWKHCHDCGQLLVYTSDPNAKPQVCAGRKP